MGTCLSLTASTLDVYKFDGTTYQRVIHFTQASTWFGGASVVSRDGSTVGSFAANFTNWLSGEVVLFDVASAQCSVPIPCPALARFKGHRSAPNLTITGRSWLSLRGAQSSMTGRR